MGMLKPKEQVKRAVFGRSYHPLVVAGYLPDKKKGDSNSSFTLPQGVRGASKIRANLLAKRKKCEQIPPLADFGLAAGEKDQEAG